MAVIEHIVIRCHKQEDVTGSDDLKVYLNDVHMGNIDGISSGETRDVRRVCCSASCGSTRAPG